MKDIYFKVDEDFKEIISNSLKEENINKVNLIPTGWTNIVYEVETDNGSCFFRFPRDEFWARTIVKDYEFSKYIHKKTDFTTNKLELLYDNGRPFSVHKKIPGTPLADKMDNLTDTQIENICAEISEFMHQLHCLKYKEDNIFSIKNIGLELTDFLTELLELHVSKKDREFWKIKSIKENEKCLVHGDLNSSNILLDENNHVTAIIDFGFGGFGEAYDDIARIISRCPDKFRIGIIKNYEAYSKTNLNYEKIDSEVNKWKNIDQGYINYMKAN